MGVRSFGPCVGFHGCSGEVAEAVLSGAHLEASDNDYDWLGSGIYFWLDTAERAMAWAQQRKKKQPSVVGAIINPGNCLNLADSSHINSIKASYELLREASNNSGNPMPENSRPDAQGLCLLRRLDCAVIQLLHTVRKRDNKPEFDSVVGVFEEGPPIFPGSGMKEKTHVQIAVRNTDNILGYFKPKCTTAIATARNAIDLLESGGVNAPVLYADALSARSAGMKNCAQFSEAAFGYLQTQRIHLALGEPRLAADAASGLARVWMRQGQLEQALNQIQSSTATYAKLKDVDAQLAGYNTALRIQIELLKWQDALVSSDKAMRLLEKTRFSGREYRTMQLRALVFVGLNRLREAKSMLEEAEARLSVQNLLARDPSIHAMYYLANREFLKALEYTKEAFSTSAADSYNILLDGQDGALLLWVMAAHGVHQQGQSLPEPSAAQLAILQQPKSTLARVAKGYWFLTNGQTASAQIMLAQANTEALKLNHHYRAQLASAPFALPAVSRAEKLRISTN